MDARRRELGCQFAAIHIPEFPVAAWRRTGSQSAAIHNHVWCLKAFPHKRRWCRGANMPGPQESSLA